VDDLTYRVGIRDKISRLANLADGTPDLMFYFFPELDIVREIKRTVPCGELEIKLDFIENKLGNYLLIIISHQILSLPLFLSYRAEYTISWPISPHLPLRAFSPGYMRGPRSSHRRPAENPPGVCGKRKNAYTYRDNHSMLILTESSSHMSSISRTALPHP
jgi:hypothetical protein